MAIVKGPIVFTGSLSNVSFYTRRGSDKVIVRTKGGASKAKIKSSPKFEGFRKQQKEWSACAKFGSVTRYAFGGLHRIADYNLTPVLNGMGKNLMKLDKTTDIGQRNLFLTAYPQALEGFNFNRNYPFNTVLRVSPHWEFAREKSEVIVQIPRINTETDIYNLQKLPYFRLIIAVGVVSDITFNTTTNEYEPVMPLLHGISETTTGKWLPVQGIVPAHTLTVDISENEFSQLNDHVTLILSMAIEFGQVGFTGEPVEVKYAGSGKVLASI